MPRHNKSTKQQRKIYISIDCSNKRAFRQEFEAQRAAEFAMLERPDVDLSTYKCDGCAYWHLTSIKPPKP